jgi:hypothetical protein
VSYLKPNFRNHPANWIAVAAVFVASFGITSANAYNLSTDNYILEWSSYQGDVDINAYYEKVAVFQQYGGQEKSYTTSSFFTMPGFGSCHGYILQTWPGQVAYHVWIWGEGSNTCSLPADKQVDENGVVSDLVTCPAIGTAHTGTVDLKSTLDNWTEGDSFTYPKTIAYDGCEYSTVVVGDQGEIYASEGGEAKVLDGVTYWSDTWYATGNTSTGSENWNDVLTGTASEPDLNQAVTDDRQNTSSVSVADPVVVTDESGTVTTEQTTTTQTAGSGTLVLSDGTTYTVTESGGITKTTTETTVTAENLDGSKTETIQTDTTYTQNPSTTISIDNSTQTINYTTSPGTTSGSGTTKTNTYDPNGNLTGSTEQSSTAADESATCEDTPNAVECKTYVSADSFYESDGTLTYDGVMTNFKNTVQAAGFYQAATGFFDLNIGSHSCPVWTADVGDLGTITIDHLCTDFGNTLFSVISAVLLIVAGWIAFRIAIL